MQLVHGIRKAKGKEGWENRNGAYIGSESGVSGAKMHVCVHVCKCVCMSKICPLF